MRKVRKKGIRAWLVEPYKQVRLGLVIVLVNVFFGVLFLSLFSYYVYDIYNSVMLYFKLAGQDNIVTLSKMTHPVMIFAALFLVFVILTFLISIKYTHDIYGPIVSINRHLDQITQGDFPAPLRLRTSDQLKQLADRINSLSEQLQARDLGGKIPIERFIDEWLSGTQPTQLKLRERDNLNTVANKLNDLYQKLAG